jgi:hypothetical protein
MAKLEHLQQYRKKIKQPHNSNETMPNAEQFMLTLSEHQTIQPVLVGVYMARALVLPGYFVTATHVSFIYFLF